ncbi:hypothetical protein V4U86_02415 [Mycobacterium sp. AMU20-3851]|uniref:hypothetical protein n=1 Tax=Mycobacterium sp. AMU20-3851 TaxID=3122055 RepID=UPI0037542068
MTTALILLAILAPFPLAGLLIRQAYRQGNLRLHLKQFRPAAPFAGRLAGSDHGFDRDGLRTLHELDAIRTRFEHQPAWPTSSASGERR